MIWAVVGVNDDGRSFIVNKGMCHAAADALAGAMRDQSTDEEIEAGWNYLPIPTKQTRPSMVRPMLYPPPAPQAPSRPHTCGRIATKSGLRCGDIVGGVQTIRCRPCAYQQDGETSIRRQWKRRDEKQKHIGAAKTNPRSWRRPAPRSA